MEEHILHLVERNITLRKTTIHSAVAEDGRVPNLVWRDGGAGGSTPNVHSVEASSWGGDDAGGGRDRDSREQSQVLLHVHGKHSSGRTSSSRGGGQERSQLVLHWQVNGVSHEEEQHAGCLGSSCPSD